MGLGREYHKPSPYNMELQKKVWEASPYLTVVFLTVALWDAGSAGFHILL